MDQSNTACVFTQDEVRDLFLGHLAGLIEYWATIPEGGSVRTRLEGLAHSFLVLLDGNAVALPGFVVAPAPHSSDREYSIASGENYYPDAPVVSCDIAGELHEAMYAAIEKHRLAR